MATKIEIIRFSINFNLDERSNKAHKKASVY